MAAVVIVLWADGATTRRNALDLADAERLADQIRRTSEDSIDEIRIEHREPAW